MKISQDHPLVSKMVQWRHHLHAHPETAFEEVQTADYVKTQLENMGLMPYCGLAKTGLVASLSNGDGPAIALRADMDALDLTESSDVEHRSRYDGKMHGCGHDGHMAMLLGAAAYLCENRNFKGTVHFVFQPAEENEGGGRVMVEEGLFDKFPCDAVYGMHNWPEMAAGTMALKAGPLMAACDTMDIRIIGKGCHGAMPHLGLDPVVVPTEILLAFQSLTTPLFNPQDAGVVSVTQIHAGHTWNVIPNDVLLRGTIRSFTPKVRQTLEDGIRRIVKGVCDAHGADFELSYAKGYPATVNDEEQSEICARVATQTVGAQNVDLNPTPSMGAEDFAYMLQARPGCYVWLGSGGLPGGCLLHNPGFDFNDAMLPVGASYWVNLVEDVLKA
jgi:hippurate hydrolase